ncbi:hypothetical protein AX16_000588 [Volvariella volvacea WC 439]|nr:hypothetical protein AX16_000588 [Volvariella volvacea WC 439]
MYRYTLPPQFTTAPSYGYPAYPSFSAPSPRERYLAAVAQARKAEEEYLAAEAARQEELALRQRLAEIELQRQLEEQELQRQLQLRARRAPRIAYPAAIPGYMPDYLEAGVDVPQFGYYPRSSACHYSHCAPQPASSYQRPIAPQSAPQTVDLQTLRALLNSQQRPQQRVPTPVYHEPRKTQTVDLNELVNALIRPASPAPVPQVSRPQRQVPTSSQPSTQAITLEELADLLSGRPINSSPAPEPPKAPTPRPQPSAEERVSQMLQELFGGAVQANTQVKKQPSQSQLASSSKPASKPKAPAPKPAPAAKPVTAPVPQPKPAEKSLKEQLESRLNNEYTSEVRDTIEALLASLTDNYAPSYPKPAPTTPASTTSGKGKAKEVEQKPRTSSTPNALGVIGDIQSTFHSLESEFVFPAHLDFVAPSDVELSSPVSPSGSYTSKLAFTSNNQPVRFYQQALGTLLSKLDAVESNGNDELRKKRKEVVAQVEKALEELEDEVERRWRTWVAKQKKQKAQEFADSESVVESEATVRPRRESKGRVDVEEVEDEAVRAEREKRRSFSGSEPTSIIAPIVPEEVIQEQPKTEVEVKIEVEVETEAQAEKAEEVESASAPAPVEVPSKTEDLPPTFESEPSTPEVVSSELPAEEVAVEEVDVVEVTDVSDESEVEVVQHEVQVVEEPDFSVASVDSVPSSPSSEASALPSIPENKEEEKDVEVSQAVQSVEAPSYPPSTYPPSSTTTPQVDSDPSESVATIRPLSPPPATTAPTLLSTQDANDSDVNFSETEGFLQTSESSTTKSEHKRLAYKDQSDDDWSEVDA